MMRGVYTIDPECRFLDDLAHGLIEELGADLARCLVLLPSRRACVELRHAFLRAATSDALLLPRMQPVGEVEPTDPLFGDPTAGLEILPAIDPLRRRLLLATLVKHQRAAQGGITDEHALRLAGELAAFLDEMRTEEVPLDRLDDLVPDELAEHWRQILEFLHILGENWPAVLAEEGAVDPPERRRLLLERITSHWSAYPPDLPVIAAGMTGTVPAVARLLACVAHLPRGCILLPGLDLDMDEAGWLAVGSTPAHPQYGLCRLLEVVGIDRALVGHWPWQRPVASAARRRFLAETMRPAATSEAWRHVARPSDAALAGLERIELPGFAQEALVLALEIREGLEEPERTIALVTSDRTLARRVAVELRRFGVEADDTAGTPLDQSPPGSFLLLAARAVIEDLAPVPLLSLLKHPLAAGGSERLEFRRHTRALELALLRGPRCAGGFAGLHQEIARLPQDKHWAGIDAAALGEWLGKIETAAAPLCALMTAEEVPWQDLLTAHLSFAEWLTSDAEGDAGELWAKEAGEAAASFMASLTEASIDAAPVAPSAYPALLAVLMGSVAVRGRPTGHPRVSILGQLESRLIAADRVLLAGLNEGVWPRAVDPSPWVNRSMRATLGLPPAELRIGIAAHDLLMAATAPECVLSRARKDHAAAPTTASRWLTRLDAVLRMSAATQVIDHSARWLALAGTIDAHEGPVKARSRPEPKPPLEARPDEAWVTDIETLIRDPYAYYAHRILDLSALEPLDADPGAAERGQIIHKALELFVREFPDHLPEDAESRVIEIGRKLFDEVAHRPQVQAIWWPRFCEIARWFVEQERQRRTHLARILAERTGELRIDTATGRFMIRARADRVELDKEGRVNLVDYKTGQVPKPKQVAAGLAPQLTLSGVIIEGGGFIEGADRPGELLYWSLQGGHKGCEEHSAAPKGDEAADLLEAARQGIIDLVDWYRDPEHGYPAVPRPEIAPAHGDYEHLARIDEWRGQVVDEDAS